MKDDKKLVKLKADHYVNGMKKKAGTVVMLDNFSARWLVKLGRAVEVRR